MSLPNRWARQDTRLISLSTFFQVITILLNIVVIGIHVNYVRRCSDKVELCVIRFGLHPVIDLTIHQNQT